MSGWSSVARQRAAAWAAGVVTLLAGCASVDDAPAPSRPALTAEQGRALVARLLPETVTDRRGWATDIYAAFASLDIAPTPDNLCAAIAVTEQESSFQADPPVPGLSAIAWKEIERQRERAGIPRLVLDAALALRSATGASYAERLNAVTTEKQLSQIYEDLIGSVPLGTTFLADRNPVRTGGPMQVSIAFAERHAAEHPYPYPVDGSIRREVFTRRGGMYFGIAHLLGYPASYDRHRYRFADFNAGHYASRNAAFQRAVTEVSGIPLELDGDLLRYEAGRPAREPGSTELALRTLQRRLDLSAEQIREDLLREKEHRFERTRLFARVHALAERTAARALPRAIAPQIPLKSPKITRKLTTEWFADRVEQRFRRCLRRLEV